MLFMAWHAMVMAWHNAGLEWYGDGMASALGAGGRHSAGCARRVGGVLSYVPLILLKHEPQPCMRASHGGTTLWLLARTSFTWGMRHAAYHLELSALCRPCWCAGVCLGGCCGANCTMLRLQVTHNVGV